MRTILIIFSLYFALDAFTQSTISFVATKDTYINSAVPSSTQGTNSGFVASAWTYNGQFGTGHSLIGFETCELPEDFQIVEATLHLYFNPTSGHAGHTTDGLNSAKAYRITSSWDETTTWNTQPSYDNTDFAVLPSATTADQDYTIVVTTIVTNAFTNGSNVSFYLKLDDEQLYRSLIFAAREHPDETIRPTLKITYTTSEDWCNSGGTDPDPDPDPDSDPNNEEDTTCQESIRIPNVFTPNNDGVNDYFYINADCNFDEFTIEVVNRWGSIVFGSTDQSFEWYGKEGITGRELVEGVYFYKVRASLDGEIVEKHGFIHLIRGQD